MYEVEIVRQAPGDGSRKFLTREETYTRRNRREECSGEEHDAKIFPDSPGDVAGASSLCRCHYADRMPVECGGYRCGRPSKVGYNSRY